MTVLPPAPISLKKIGETTEKEFPDNFEILVNIKESDSELKNSWIIGMICVLQLDQVTDATVTIDDSYEMVNCIIPAKTITINVADPTLNASKYVFYSELEIVLPPFVRTIDVYLKTPTKGKGKRGGRTMVQLSTVGNPLPGFFSAAANSDTNQELKIQ